ncbi:phosphate ABC transporter permease subunit PstC [Orrella marina]|nr:phosphate ABC transporter permease subunit PstC [Orrella marina]
MVAYLLIATLLIATAGYWLNYQASRRMRLAGKKPISMDTAYGMYALLMIALPSLLFILAWLLFGNVIAQAIMMASLPEGAFTPGDVGAHSLIRAEIISISRGQIFGTPEPYKLEAAEYLNRLMSLSTTIAWAGLIAIALGALVYSRKQVRQRFSARTSVETIVRSLMILCSLVAILTTIGIVFSLVFESLRFFAKVPFWEFFLGTNWEPQIAIRADQVGGSGSFGWLPVLMGTLVITVIASIFAIPVGIATGIYLKEFASSRARTVIKPILEILAGVPTVVYGFFAILVIAPALRSTAAMLGIGAAPNMALAAGMVMGVMLIPFISSFTDDALNAVPRGLRDGSLALGATQSETVLKVLFPAAIPGIVGGILLAISRAIGETMIVVMAAGLIATMTINPLDSVTTITVQIVTMLIGDTEFDNPKTLSAFALGLMLFVVTLILNVLALRIVRKYREMYD